MADRQNISTGSKWEPLIGYSRAVKAGNMIFVSGTTGPGNGVYEQTKAALAVIVGALAQAGAKPEHVVRTRIFTTKAAEWEAIGKAHGEVFGEIRPATAIIGVAALVDPALLVEIEADAVL